MFNRVAPSILVSGCLVRTWLDKAVECKEEVLALESTIGNTPLLYLKSVSEATGCDIYGKAEFLNPTGSVKDRAAKQIILEAERSGRLKKGGTIVEGTGGNTGVALAALGAAKGYNVKICMPHFIGKEKQNLTKLYGAEVFLCPGVPFSDSRNYAKKAESLGNAPNTIFTNQFENYANYRAHYGSTGPEIWNQTNRMVDAFVCAAGTGGTIAGISSYLKEVSNERVKCFIIDPAGSSLYKHVNEGLLRGSEGSTEIEGIGIGRLTNNFKMSVLDGAIQGSDQEATDMMYYLLQKEGLYLGPSAALNVVGAIKIAKKLGPGHQIVTILCDGGERYASKFYDDTWLADQHLSKPSKWAVNTDEVIKRLLA